MFLPWWIDLVQVQVETPLISIENVKGSHGDDIINGNDGPNLLKGLDGADEINGRDGDDVIIPNRPANPGMAAADIMNVLMRRWRRNRRS